MKKPVSLLLAALLLLSMSACSKSEPSKGGLQESNTLVDTDQYRFHVASVSEFDSSGCVLALELENRTETALLFSATNASVNGCMIDPQFSESVSGGEATESRMIFDLQQLADYGIEQVTEIAFNLCIYDEYNYEEPLLDQLFTLYPHGKEAVSYQTREKQSTDIVLLDDENCSIIVTGYDPDSFWGYDLYVYLLNKTDSTLLFSAKDVSVNGTPCDPYWSATVAPGKCSNTVVYWFDNTLADAGIDQIEKILMTLTATDVKSWPDGTIATKTVTFTP